jgi:hypothetical protein
MAVAITAAVGGSGQSEGGEPIDDERSAFAQLLPLDRTLCVVSTLRGDRSIQSAIVNAGVLCTH